MTMQQASASMHMIMQELIKSGYSVWNGRVVFIFQQGTKLHFYENCGKMLTSIQLGQNNIHKYRKLYFGPSMTKSTLLSESVIDIPMTLFYKKSIQTFKPILQLKTPFLCHSITVEYANQLDPFSKQGCIYNTLKYLHLPFAVLY